MPAMRSAVRLLAVTVVIGLASLGGYRLLGGASEADARPSGVATSSAEAAAASVPVGFDAWTETVSFNGHRTEVHMQLPADGRLSVLPADREWRVDVSDLRGNSESWGILVADVTGATNHTTRSGSGDVPIGAADPATFLDRMNATRSYVVDALTGAEVGGHPALETSIQAVVADHHLDVNGEGGIMFDRPNRVLLARVRGALIMVQVWALTDRDLHENLSLAELIIESMRLTPVP